MSIFSKSLRILDTAGKKNDGEQAGSLRCNCHFHICRLVCRGIGTHRVMHRSKNCSQVQTGQVLRSIITVHLPPNSQRDTGSSQLDCSRPLVWTWQVHHSTFRWRSRRFVFFCSNGFQFACSNLMQFSCIKVFLWINRIDAHFSYFCISWIFETPRTLCQV